jgi:hypothetical protein
VVVNWASNDTGMRKVVMISGFFWTSHNNATQSGSAPIRELWVVFAFVQVLYEQLDNCGFIVG